MPRPQSFKTHSEYLSWYADYRAKTADRRRAYNRAYNSLWRKENGYHNEINSIKKYREKQLARMALFRAIKRSVIKRGNCEVCGKPDAQGHHEDYSKPFAVKWFCPLHHREYETAQNHSELSTPIN